ncbi:GFA family protein [Halocynthiibacter sp. C4]|uniref:GFA family protein n=1 Tax=Halocynthiibacter sp. C4 TaxID=2992758 RepID=UPI00237BA9AC|nr:GFA family protein [Halocynthiibacter sp. C4]MDE0588974.1 GFA family protein [Halocynthiibacter sp. C4]
MAHTGSCLCGAITFEISGALTAPDACHCTMCRKTSGHFWASTDIDKSALNITDASSLKWFQSSAKVRRGFCETCGSSLFWEPLNNSGKIAVAMGAIDHPTEIKLGMHIFTAEKGDYYDIKDGLPQNAT